MPQRVGRRRFIRGRGEWEIYSFIRESRIRGKVTQGQRPMNRRHRAVPDRQRALEPTPPQANFTLHAARDMYAAIEGKAFSCVITGYCRTRIFEFPRIDYHGEADEPHQSIFASPTVKACVATDLVRYFENSTSKHYSISPSLRQAVRETAERIESQMNGGVPVFVLIEENNQLTPIEMDKGECSLSPEVIVRDDEEVPILVGGRTGQEFITAWHTIDGAWPELPNNQLLVNMILAGVRAGQHTPDPIRKHLDQDGLVTDDDRYVEMMRPTMSAKLSVATQMDTTAFKGRVSEIRSAIAAMEQDIGAPHMALLINSMYRDEYKDDAYLRLHYLRLWQSLVDAGRPYLNYSGNIRHDKVVVAGNKTLQELNGYRDDIAHWWTDTIDENFLSDLQRTINELIRRKYF